MPHLELSFKLVHPCLSVSSCPKSAEVPFSGNEPSRVHRENASFLFILALVLFSNFFLAPLTLKAAADSLEIAQIHEFEMASHPTESFHFLDLLHKPEQFLFERVRWGDSILWKRNYTFISRFKLPEISMNEMIFEVLYNAPESSDNFGIRIYVLDGEAFHEISPLQGRYAVYKISKDHLGKMIYVLKKSDYFSTFWPAIYNLLEVNAYYRRDAMDRTYIGLVLGIIGIMALYNFGMLFLFRKLYLFYYFLYCFGVLLQFLQTSGLFGYSNGSILTYFLSPMIAMVFMILFSMNVLNIKYESRRLYYLGFIIIGAASTSIILAIAGNEIVLKYLLLVAPPVLMFCFYLAARSAYHGYRPAFPMMLGWSALLIAMTLSAMQFLISGFPNMGWALPIAISFEIATFSFATGQKLRLSELKFMHENQHAFSEMKKMVYPHQLSRIRKGETLELTMPTSTAQACVLSFDIIGSSKIQHIKAKEFFRNTFTRCNEIISEGYDGNELKANAYRIKEMGDGFLCSIGFPFLAMSQNPANDSIDLAKRFARVLEEEARMLHSETPIACGIGIAIDTLTGFYPDAGAKEYDLYGQAIVLATRYEGMRKTLFEAEKGRSVLIIQEKVFLSLDPSHRDGFIAMNLKESGIVVRDDPSAERLFYQFLGDSPQSNEDKDRHLKVV